MKSWNDILHGKIIIYGTGKNAQRFIENHKDVEIVAVIDRVKFEGDFCGIPILMWSDLEVGMADAVVIASVPKYYDEICKRIIFNCLKYELEIWGKSGECLWKNYLFNRIDKRQIKYFKKTQEQLLRQIDEHEAISFDIFDTLVMRKVLEPVDVFDIVEYKLSERNIKSDNFKKKRRTSEIEISNADIYGIYNRLALVYSWTEQEKEIALQEELESEKAVLVCRKKIVEALKYAVAQGKKVSLISDMYLPEKELREILTSLGIEGYEGLYVSCDYGKGKGSGLFEIYKQNVPAASYLHIGDNHEVDNVAAQLSGINAFEIFSALDMLRASNLNHILIEAEENRFFLGKMLASIFNDPFALHETCGVVQLSEISMATCTFWMPCVLKYLNTLSAVVQKDDYKGILFGARDGYYMKQLYEKYYSEEVPKGTDLVYFMTSRLLALKATIEEEQDLISMSNYLGKQNESALKKMFQTTEYYEEAKRTRRNYLRYFEWNDIDLSQKYVICDLISSGTVQGALNRLFVSPLKGVYLKKVQRVNGPDVEVESAIGEGGDTLSGGPVNFLEKVFTAPHPSVVDMYEDGQPVFAKETRTTEELEIIEKIQNSIQDEFDDVKKTYGKMINITDKCILALLVDYKEFDYTQELDFINHWTLVDDICGREFSIV